MNLSVEEIKKLFREFIINGDYRSKTWHQEKLREDFVTYIITDFNAWLDNHGIHFLEEKKKS